MQYRGYTGYTLHKRRKQRGALMVQLMLATLALVGTSGYYFTRESRDADATVASGSVSSVAKQAASVVPEIEQSVTLRGVGAGPDVGKAKATRRIMTGRSVILVIAELPKLEAKNFYEAWAVQSSPYKFISLGTLIERTDGKFGLAYETADNVKNFGQIIVTREKDDDPAPGAHVVEGNF